MANNDDLKVTGPGGFGVSARGRDTVIIVLLVAALAWMGHSTARSFDRIEEAARLVATASVSEHREILCVLALDGTERKAAVRSGNVCAFLFGEGPARPRRAP